MRLASVALALVLLVPVAAASAAYYRGGYLAGDGNVIVSDANSGYGGFIFPPHDHDTTVAIAVSDLLPVAVPAIACQDVDADSVCDTRSGSPDRFRCFRGSTSGFAVVANRPVAVWLVRAPHRVPFCGQTGLATTGSVDLTYS